MGGGFLALFGLGRRQRTRGGEPALAETLTRPQRRRKGAAPEGADEFCRYSTRRKEAAWERRVGRSEEEGEACGRWVAGVDVDRRAKEFIDRVHYRRMHPDQ